MPWRVPPMREPCRSCDRREIDWGGCRCQALALTGDARNADPACHKSPDHERIVATAMAESESGAARLTLAIVEERGRTQGACAAVSGCRAAMTRDRTRRCLHS